MISAVCLHYSILGSLGELEQLKRGLQTAGLSALLEQHGSVMKDLFLHQDKKVTADFIQDLFEVEYPLLGFVIELLLLVIICSSRLSCRNKSEILVGN